MDKVGEVLMAAAELVEKGWTQHRSRNGDRVCATQAISACSRLEPDTIFFESLSRVKSAAGIPPSRSVTSWNDDERRTQEQVVTALRLAAELPA